MSSLTLMQLSPTTVDSRVWSLSSSDLFSIKYFFLVLSKSLDLVPFFLASFVWKSKASSKVKVFSWLVVHKKVNTNDLLQVRRSYKSFSPHWCILCKGNGEAVDHLFLHCPLALELWHKLFKLAPYGLGAAKEY